MMAFSSCQDELLSYRFICMLSSCEFIFGMRQLICSASHKKRTDLNCPYDL
ncbi:hypothetical protein AAKU64_004583 [Undibacterium sp. GrIS 1.8]